jgi:RHS repeat-associated protein
VTYDQYGRVFQEIDATGKGVPYSYNANGFREKVVEATNATQVYQVITATNAAGQATSQGLLDAQFQLTHNYDVKTGLPSTMLATSNYAVPRTLYDGSYTFDAVGNLKTRVRKVQAEGALLAKTLNETYTYDQLNRLTLVAPTGMTNVAVAYDINGNITNKTGVGAYTYGSATVGPHAVKSTTNETYTYDAVGNMTGSNATGTANDRTVQYNTSRVPTRITKGTATTKFSYGPDRKRYKREDISGTTTTKTIYVGNVELISVNGAAPKTKRYIGSSIVVNDTPGSSTPGGNNPATHEELALITDHLGSTVAIGKANDAGFLKQEDYDAFGVRRSAWSLTELVAADKTTLNALTTHGFTGHEMIDGVGLVHMNGRVYDPKLGRFMSADPFITELDNSQNMNRYSYVYNNPLSAIDPSGFAEEKIEEIIIRGVRINFDYGAFLGGGYANNSISIDFSEVALEEWNALEYPSPNQKNRVAGRDRGGQLCL